MTSSPGSTQLRRVKRSTFLEPGTITTSSAWTSVPKRLLRKSATAWRTSRMPPAGV